jgi:hypothetical protein
MSPSGPQAEVSIPVDNFRFSADSGNGSQAANKIQIWTAPVSPQKRREQTTTNAIERKRKSSKINEPVRYPVAHNGLVNG